MKEKIVSIILISGVLFSLSVKVSHSAGTVELLNSSGSIINTYTTVQQCANVAAAGNTCLVYAGTYDERVIPTNSGTSNTSRITFRAASGTRPKVRGFTLTNKNYVTVDGLEFTRVGMSADANASIIANNSIGINILNNYFFNIEGIAVRTVFGGAISPASQLKIVGNTFNKIGTAISAGGAGYTVALQLWMNDGLVDDNDFSEVGDYMNTFGERNVVRNNILHDSAYAEATGNKHIDGWQSYCTASVYPAANYLLLENNIHINNPDAHSHFALVNTTSPCGGTRTNIIRQNTIHNLGSGVYYADTISSNPSHGDYHKFYNNTIVGANVSNPNFYLAVVMNGVSYSHIINNIFVDAVTGTKQMYLFDDSGTDVGDYNLAFMTSGPVTWGNPIAQEPHGLRNIDPLFTNLAGDNFNLKSTSPAKDTGGFLTTTTNSGSNSTNLAVGDSHFFQPGWAGTNPDKVSVGTTGNVAQISSIDYSTNTITLASPLSWSLGDPIYLHSNSSGVQVLYGSAPDMGAYEYNSGGTPPPPPPPQPPVDVNPPILSSISASAITATTANITWNTDEASDTQVDYGLTTSYGQQTILNSSLVTSHSQSLSGLTFQTLYHYRVKSRDLAGNLSVSQDFSFTTQAGSNPTPLPGDLNLDHIVNSIDFSLLNSQWFQNYPSYDLNSDTQINSLDFAVMSNNWLKTW